MSAVELVQACNDRNKQQIKGLVKTATVTRQINNLVKRSSIKNPVFYQSETTALCVACMVLDHNIVTMLLHNGSRSDVKTSGGSCAIHYACTSETDSLLKVKALVASDRHNINMRGWRETTPLHEASSKGALDLVMYFLENGADSNAVDRNGETSLHRAARGNHAAALSVLLTHAAAHINKLEEHGNSALHHAAEFACEDAVQILIAHTNCDTSLYNNNGYTALALAKSQPHKQRHYDGVIGLLQNPGHKQTTQYTIEQKIKYMGTDTAKSMTMDTVSYTKKHTRRDTTSVNASDNSQFTVRCGHDYARLEEKLLQLEQRFDDLENKNKRLGPLEAQINERKNIDDAMNVLRADMQVIQDKMKKIQPEHMQSSATTFKTVHIYDDENIARAVRHHFEHLKENIRCEDHQDYLYQEKAISLNEFQKLEAIHGSKDKMRTLLVFLLGKGDNSWAAAFLQSLREHESCIRAVELIEETCRNPHEIRPTTAK